MRKGSQCAGREAGFSTVLQLATPCETTVLTFFLDIRFDVLLFVHAGVSTTSASSRNVATVSLAPSFIAVSPDDQFLLDYVRAALVYPIFSLAV